MIDFFAGLALGATAGLLLGHWAARPKKEPLPLCETTLTPRLPCALRCGTYAGNLGPCETWEVGRSGRCVYCDHGKQCHVLSSAYAGQIARLK
jgi:hypothetical protein